MSRSVTSRACANIAFVKYWGNRPEGGNLPLNPSISMNLSGCVTTTRLDLVPGSKEDALILNGEPASAEARQRASAFLDQIRGRVRRTERARITSANSFPTGAGIASSAAGFAALAVASAALYGLNADEAELSRLARLGSGSAARSVPDGFVELHPSETHEGAFAVQIAPASHWPELRDIIVVVEEGHKDVSSSDGHQLAHTSEMFAARLAAIPARADAVRRAILDRDVTRLGEASETDALSMHAVMMTSHPALIYWTGGTIEVMRAVADLRQKGTEAYFTIDAGPNVHVITLAQNEDAVAEALSPLGSLRVESPGPGATIIEEKGTA